jgi:molybdate transport system ATP-binding protein
VSLDADIAVSRPGFRLDVSLSTADGEVVCVLGPNGAGKTTLLSALAGTVPLSGGTVRLGSAVLEDARTGERLPPDRRGIGVVHQDYLLFPHLSAVDNVAYGLRARGLRRGPAREAALSWLDRMGIPELAGRRPGALSGGQAQRVALARALAVQPRLLLLDEPLAALDAGTRLSIRADLRRHLTSYGGPAVVVTHDLVEAMVLADRLVVLEDGRVVQSGAPAEVARRPRTAYVAGLVGLNLIRAGGPLGGTGDQLLAVRPSAVRLSRVPGRSQEWQGRVAGLEAVGARVRVSVAGEPDVLAELDLAAVAELGLTDGTPVWVAVDPADVDAY